MTLEHSEEIDPHATLELEHSRQEFKGGGIQTPPDHLLVGLLKITIEGEPGPRIFKVVRLLPHSEFERLEASGVTWKELIRSATVLDLHANAELVLGFLRALQLADMAKAHAGPSPDPVVEHRAEAYVEECLCESTTGTCRIHPAQEPIACLCEELRPSKGSGCPVHDPDVGGTP